MAAALTVFSLAAISCGVYGYPIEEAAPVAIDTTYLHLRDHPSPAVVMFVLFGDADHKVYERHIDACNPHDFD